MYPEFFQMLCQVCDGRSVAIHLQWPIADPLFAGANGTHLLRGLDGGRDGMADFDEIFHGHGLPWFRIPGGFMDVYGCLWLIIPGGLPS